MILFVSGATGGHIYPAIAMAEALDEPSFFVVPRANPAQDILTPYSFDFEVVRWSFKQVVQWPMVIASIVRLMIKKKPSVVIAMGGGICVPFAIVAWAFRCPVLSFEQNAIPGRATKVIQFVAKKIITAFDAAADGLIMKSKVACLGNPIRTTPSINDDVPNEWSAMDTNTLLIIGGSQGAKSINEFISKHRVDIMRMGLNIIHLTGKGWGDFSIKNQGVGDGDEEKNQDEKGVGTVEMINDRIYMAIPYLSNIQMAYKKARVVICRAGATTIAELRHEKIPSIFIPYPYAMDNHQEKNAEAFLNEMSHGAMIKEPDLTMDTLTPILNRCLTMTVPDPTEDAEKVVSTICEFIKSYLK